DYPNPVHATLPPPGAAARITLRGRICQGGGALPARTRPFFDLGYIQPGPPLAERLRQWRQRLDPVKLCRALASFRQPARRIYPLGFFATQSVVAKRSRQVKAIRLPRYAWQLQPDHPLRTVTLPPQSHAPLPAVPGFPPDAVQVVPSAAAGK